MKFISEIDNIYDNCKTELLGEYNVEKIEKNILKRMDFEGVALLFLPFFIILFLIMVPVKLLLNINYNIALSWGIILSISASLSLLISFIVNFVGTKEDRDYEISNAQKVTNACLNFNYNEFVSFLKKNFYQKYCEIIAFDLLINKKAELLSVKNKDKSTVIIRYSENGLVKEFYLPVDYYEYRTDIEEDELLLDKSGLVTHRRKYEET